MRKNREEALRWLRQAEFNLQVAESNLIANLYSASCFMSEQTAQVALKAYLTFKTGRAVPWIHSVKKLAETCLEFDSDFEKVVEYGKILDRYYIITRYPDALAPPSAPFEIYIQGDAQQAAKFSREIVEKVKKELLAQKNEGE